MAGARLRWKDIRWLLRAAWIRCGNDLLAMKPSKVTNTQRLVMFG